MKLDYAPQFRRSYNKAPAHIQKVFNKQSLLLLQNLRHPSLRAKKYSESEDLWQARITRDWGFYFVIKGDTYIVQDIIPHPK